MADSTPISTSPPAVAVPAALRQVNLMHGA
jgi:hypothetical protein